MVAKVKKRSRSGVLLPLKQHRCTGRQQEQRRHGFVSARGCEYVGALAAGSIRNLIVILKECDKCVRVKVERVCSPTLPLPFIPLALIKITVFDRGNKLLRRAFVIAVICSLRPVRATSAL